jgi:glycosyltransferase involved in cell wall biosynthesis
MRVLVNCLSLRSGGAVAYLRNLLPLLSTELGRRDAELIALTRADQQQLLPASLPDNQRIVVPSAEVAGIMRLVWERGHLGTITRTTGARVIFTPYQIGTPVHGVRTVSMLRNMEPFFAATYPYTLKSRVRNHILRVQTRRFLHRSDAVIAVSDYVADYARTALALNPQRITRIYHGRDSAFSEGTTNVGQGKLGRLGIQHPYVFSCGSFLPYRRLEDVIHAFADFVAKRVDHPVLVLAGSGTDSHYRKRIASLTKASPFAAQIHYVGQVDRDTMVALYRQSRVFVTSTEIEACPNIALEALSAGCRILSADIPVLREIFGSAATFYPARHVAALASGIEHAWTDEVGSEVLRAAARSRSQAFSWQACARETAELLIRV